jgi:hypothetical protein
MRGDETSKSRGVRSRRARRLPWQVEQTPRQVEQTPRRTRADQPRTLQGGLPSAELARTKCHGVRPLADVDEHVDTEAGATAEAEEERARGERIRSERSWVATRRGGSARSCNVSTGRGVHVRIPLHRCAIQGDCGGREGVGTHPRPE